MQPTVAPDIDGADDGSLSGVLKSWIRSFIRENLDDMLPAQVVSYDDASNRAVIKPLIMVGTTDGQKISRGSIPNIPVFRYGGGGFFIRFPIKPGDFGWLKANDRDVSLMFQRGGREDWPNTERLHSFSDAMFFPDTIKDWAISGGDREALVVQSMDGGAVVAITADSVELRVGSQSLRLSSDGLQHNGVNIGATHVHGAVETGPNVSGVPQ